MSTYLEAGEQVVSATTEFQNVVIKMEVDFEDEQNTSLEEFAENTVVGFNVKNELTDDEDDMEEAKHFLLNYEEPSYTEYSENNSTYHIDFMENSDSLTDSILMYFEKKLPLVSITAVDTSQMMDDFKFPEPIDTKGLNLKNFNAYQSFTAKELESRLHNVTVTISQLERLFSSGLHPDLDTRQLTTEEFSSIYLTECKAGVEFASPLWFYLQYIKCVDNPTVEICQVSHIAATAASSAYHSAGDYPDNMPISELLLYVAMRAAFNVNEHVAAQENSQVFNS